MRTLECAELIDLASELAAGNLCGEERAAAIAHLDSCPSCQQAVNSLTTVTDRLLLLTRRVEPPVGFEQRVLAALPTDLVQQAAARDASPQVGHARRCGGGAGAHLRYWRTPHRSWVHR